MQPLMIKTVSLIVCLLGAYSGAIAQPISCRFADHLLAAALPPMGQLTVNDIVLTVGEEQSFGHIMVTNHKMDLLRYYLFILEFADDRGRHLFSVPVYSTDLHYNGATPFEFSPIEWVYGHNSYQPMTSSASRDITLNFASPAMLTRCPGHANVIFAAVWYKSGHKFISESPLLKLDPILLSSPLPNSGELLNHSSPEIEGRLDIDPEGRAAVLEIRGDQTQDDALTHTIETFTKTWIFVPMIENGEKRAATVRFVFSVGNRPISRQKIELLSVAHPEDLLWSIRAIPPSSKAPGVASRWQVFIGGDPVARGLR